MNEIDHIVYIDTDSLYISALPIILHRHPDANIQNHDIMNMHVITIATEVQEFINKSFDLFAKKFLNVDKHHFNIKQELVAKSSVFLGKKRYALKAINENGISMDKLIVKGIDTVRSDFPNAFRTLLTDVLKGVLDGVDKKKVDEMILTFKKNIRILELKDISKPTSVQDVTKYTMKLKNNEHMTTESYGFKNYIKGSPAHVKSAIMYNNLLKHYKLTDKFSEIMDGDKIKWVYLTSNEFNIDALAHRGFDDPPQILDFINAHINHEKMFNSIFLEKLSDLYSALSWDLPSESEEKFNEFFTL